MQANLQQFTKLLWVKVDECLECIADMSVGLGSSSSPLFPLLYVGELAIRLFKTVRDNSAVIGSIESIEDMLVEMLWFCKSDIVLEKVLFGLYESQSNHDVNSSRVHVSISMGEGLLIVR